jgi:hypothetical protein
MSYPRLDFENERKEVFFLVEDSRGNHSTTLEISRSFLKKNLPLYRGKA